MDPMERAENGEEAEAVYSEYRSLMETLRSTERGSSMRLSVHPATKATIPEDLHPLLGRLQEVASHGDWSWTLTQLDRDGRGGVRCAIWWKGFDSEPRRLPLSPDPEELIRQFRLCCEGVQT
jgi:hypothetical protein